MKLLLVVLVVGAVSAAPNNLGLSEIFNAYKGVGPVLLGGDQDRTENKAQQVGHISMITAARLMNMIFNE